MKQNTLGLILHPTKNVTGSIDIITAWAAAHNVVVLVQEQDVARAGGTRAGKITFVSTQKFVNEVDGIVSLGGDGTMLGAMRLVIDRRVPVLGVNYGNVGFLVEVEPRDLESAIQRLIDGHFSIEPHHSVVVVIHDDQGQTQKFFAFNDFALARTPGSGVVGASLSVSGEQYGYYRCDALVIATPAGSTAYNFSAGGPLISPALPAMVVTPVAPMAGIGRAVVLASSEEIELRTLNTTRGAAVEIDGTVLTTVGGNHRITITLIEDAGQVVRFDAAAHNQRGRVKLSLLDLPLQPDQLLELVPAELRARLTSLRDKAVINHPITEPGAPTSPAAP